MGVYIKKKTVKCPIKGCKYTSRIPIRGDLGKIGKANCKGHASYTCPKHREKLIDSHIPLKGNKLCNYNRL